MLPCSLELTVYSFHLLLRASQDVLRVQPIQAMLLPKVVNLHDGQELPRLHQVNQALAAARPLGNSIKPGLAIDVSRLSWQILRR